MIAEELLLLPQKIPEKNSTKTIKWHVIILFVFFYYIGLIVGTAGTFWIAKSHFSQFVDTENSRMKLSFSRMLKGNLSKCDAEKGLLESERAKMKTKLEGIPSTDSKCHFAWRYFNNFCYYYQGFTRNAQGDIVKYDWKTAESNCVLLGGHLVSIHSYDELNFMKKLIIPDVDMKSLNPKALPHNPCAYTEFYVWNGLHIVNGTRKLSDGSADDYHGNGDDYSRGLNYMFCNDDANENNYHYYGGSDYAEARDECRLLGGNLAMPRDTNENAAIGNAAGTFALIGVHRRSNGEWFYDDGTPSSYQNWAQGCSKDWIFFEDNCYYFFNKNLQMRNEKFTRTSAESACNRMGAHLASIHSSRENDFLLNQIFTNFFHDGTSCVNAGVLIGLSCSPRTAYSNSWIWSDGTSVDYFPRENVLCRPEYSMINDINCFSEYVWNDWPEWLRGVSRYICKKAQNKY
ncbi:unnamed protein product, partial [Mesorhabditis belari]|uniref:C-type lectin domain-containing protein n=1 Tax=Mesorhabditis belari TaxID=2138241 RepID=A0AAF3J9M3_9BILA